MKKKVGLAKRCAGWKGNVIAVETVEVETLVAGKVAVGNAAAVAGGVIAVHAVHPVVETVVARKVAVGNAVAVADSVIAVPVPPVSAVPAVHPAVETDSATLKAASTHQQTHFLGRRCCYMSSIPCALH